MYLRGLKIRGTRVPRQIATGHRAWDAERGQTRFMTVGGVRTKFAPFWQQHETPRQVFAAACLPVLLVLVLDMDAMPCRCCGLLPNGRSDQPTKESLEPTLNLWCCPRRCVGACCHCELVCQDAPVPLT